MSDITTFLSAWAQAERSRDTHFLAERLTDDFIGVGPLGFTLPKAAWLARHTGDDLRYDTFDLSEIEIRRRPAMAVVTARQDAAGTFAGHPLPRTLRNTFVLVEDDQGWRLANLHMSFVAGTPGAPPLPSNPTTK